MVDRTRDVGALDPAAVQRVAAVLVALEALDDAGLCAVIAGAQHALLDRPLPPDRADRLAVEIVDRAEGQLLAAYRVLDPPLQQHVRAYIRRLVPSSRTT